MQGFFLLCHQYVLRIEMGLSLRIMICPVVCLYSIRHTVNSPRE